MEWVLGRHLTSTLRVAASSATLTWAQPGTWEKRQPSPCHRSAGVHGEWHRSTMEDALWILLGCWTFRESSQKPRAWGHPVIQECGLTVVAIVCDCIGEIVTMAKLLGCRIHVHDYVKIKTSFPSPVNDQKVIMMFGPCHGITLLWNLLGDKGILISGIYGVYSSKNIYCNEMGSGSGRKFYSVMVLRWGRISSLVLRSGAGKKVQ